MTDNEEDSPREGERAHRFSEGQGFSDPYEGFDLDPPELSVDPSKIDPVDSYAIADHLDERNIASDQVDADALIDVGLNYMGINRNEQAVDSFERAARFADDETTEQEAWVSKGIAHAELEEWEAAIDSHREALYVAEDGDFAAEAHTNLAYALWEFGEDEEAFQHAEEAVRQNERLGHAWYNLGFIQVERGQHEDALECFDNAMRLGFRQADVYEEKSRALDGLGREEEAGEVAERAEAIREEQEAALVDER
ncbi:MAG: tetratricopeptide repeat protein [Halobacteriota archaeon]